MKKKILIIVAVIFVLVVGMTVCSCESDKTVSKGDPVKIDNSSESKEEMVVYEDDSIKIGKEDKNPRVLPENLQMEKYLDEPDSIGTVYGHMTVTNNSEYTINYIQYKVKYTNTEGKQDVTYYTSFDSILPNESSLDIESFGSEDMEVISIQYRILDTETLLECDVEYDNKTGIIQWSPWHEMY